MGGINGVCATFYHVDTTPGPPRRYFARYRVDTAKTRGLGTPSLYYLILAWSVISHVGHKGCQTREYTLRVTNRYGMCFGGFCTWSQWSRDPCRFESLDFVCHYEYECYVTMIASMSATWQWLQVWVLRDNDYEYECYVAMITSVSATW
jgi:hypothetical protein